MGVWANMTDTFSQVRYYVNLNIMVIFRPPKQLTRCSIWIRYFIAQEELRVTKVVHTTQSHTCMICPSLKEPLDITEDLDVVFRVCLVFSNH